MDAHATERHLPAFPFRHREGTQLWIVHADLILCSGNCSTLARERLNNAGDVLSMGYRRRMVVGKVRANVSSDLTECVA